MAKLYIEPELTVAEMVVKDVLLVSSNDGETLASAPDVWETGGQNG